MKIGYVVYHEYARLPIHTVEVVEALIAAGQEVVVVTAVDPAFLERLGWGPRVRVHRLPIRNRPGQRVASFAWALWQRLPALLQAEDPEVLYERMSLTTPVTARVAKQHGLPLVVEINGIVEDELRLSHAPWWRRRLQRVVERAVFAAAAHSIAVTEGIRQWMLSTYGVPPEKVTTIANATNPDRFAPQDRSLARQRWQVAERRPVIGYLGSLFPWCGLETLIDALPMVQAAVPDVLALIGGGQADLKAALEVRAIAREVAPHVRCVGEVPWAQAAEFISTFDVAVAPAQFADTRSGISPQKLYAYLACERPVVGSDIDGLGNLLEQERVGASFPAGDATSLARALIRLLQQPEEARAMGRRGRALVLQRFTWQRVAEQIAAICAQVKHNIEVGRREEGKREC